MAGTPGHAPDRLMPAPSALEAALAWRPEAFELFEALRLLERAHPQRPRLGRSSRPAEDPVRLRQTPSLAFAPRHVDRYRPADGDRPARLDVFAPGLFGPHGPLPLHLTEYAIDRSLNARDGTFAAFADIFHHRMLSLFYRAWADARPTVQADRPGDDRFRFYLGALIGMGGTSATADPVAATGARHYAGRLLPPSRNAEGLRALLEQAFGVPVRVIGFVAGWMRLPDDARLRLGRRAAVAGLGRTAVLGARVRGAQHRFRLRIGPLDGAGFRRFLPGGRTLRELAALVRTYAGDEYEWDVQLVLRAADVPPTRLGLSGRIGLDTWMGGRARDPEDAHDVVVRASAPAGAVRAAPA